MAVKTPVVTPTGTHTNLRRGNPGNKGGGRKPAAYIKFLKTRLQDPKHRTAIRDILNNAGHPHFHSCWKTVMGYVHGPPATDPEKPQERPFVVYATPPVDAAEWRKKYAPSGN